MRNFIPATIFAAEETRLESRCKIATKPVEHEMTARNTGSWFVLEEYVMENYYARFHTGSYQC